MLGSLMSQIDATVVNVSLSSLAVDLQHFAVSVEGMSRAFMLTFLALAVLHVLLLISTLWLPRVLPKALEVIELVPMNSKQINQHKRLRR